MIIRHIFSSHEVAHKTADFIFRSLEKFLENGLTLFFLSGGSVARDVAPRVFQRLHQLPKSLLSRLHVALVDERYGRPWHKESNMRLLREVGVVIKCRKLGISIHLPLVEDEKGQGEVGEISQKYNLLMSELLIKSRKRSLGVFGVGSDGHTAGIKPQLKTNFTKNFGGNESVVGYRADDYMRITLTPIGVSKLNTIVIYATGEEKRVKMRQLLTGSEKNVYRCPAVLFQSHPRAHLFTDVKIG